MIKPWGPMTEEDIISCKAAPAMKAVEIIRKYDPAWGYYGEKKNFEITIVKKVTTINEAKFTIAAPDEKTAEKIAEAQRKEWWKLDFDEVGDDDEIYIEQVEEVSA